MKIIKTGNEARVLLKRGIDTVANCVKATLGPSGRNAIISRGYGSPFITNDGATVANSIELENEIEQLGVDMIKEATKLADQKAGDGTTTTTVLTQAIIDEGFERLKEGDSLVKSKVDAMAIKREIDAECVKVVKEIEKRTKKIKTKEDIYNVAKVSVEDESLANKLTDIFDQIGKEGVVNIEDGVFELEYDVLNGFKINTGYGSHYFINNQSGEVEIKNPHVLVTNYELDTTDVLVPIISALHSEGIKQLVIVAPKFTKNVLATFISNHIKGIFTIIAVKPPYFGDDDRLEDVASFLGAKYFDSSKNDVFEITKDSLGKADKLTSTKDTTVFIGGKGDVKNQVKFLKQKSKESDSLFDKKKFDERIASLNGSVAVIKVGAQSDAEREYLRLKIEDAVNAVRYALQDGVVKGGGITLKEIAETLPESILTKALKTPYKLIQENAGGSLKIPDTIIDPAQITKSALTSACSVAGMVLTTEVAVAEKRDEPKDKSQD